MLYWAREVKKESFRTLWDRQTDIVIPRAPVGAIVGVANKVDQRNVIESSYIKLRRRLSCCYSPYSCPSGKHDPASLCLASSAVPVSSSRCVNFATKTVGHRQGGGLDLCKGLNSELNQTRGNSIMDDHQPEHHQETGINGIQFLYKLHFSFKQKEYLTLSLFCRHSNFSWSLLWVWTILIKVFYISDFLFYEIIQVYQSWFWFKWVTKHYFIWPTLCKLCTLIINFFKPILWNINHPQ